LLLLLFTFPFGEGGPLAVDEVYKPHPASLCSATLPIGEGYFLYMFRGEHICRYAVKADCCGTRFFQFFQNRTGIPAGKQLGASALCSSFYFIFFAYKGWFFPESAEGQR